MCCVARNRAGGELDAGAIQVAVGLARQCGWKRIILCVDEEPAEALMQAVQSVQCETLAVCSDGMPMFSAKKV